MIAGLGRHCWRFSQSNSPKVAVFVIGAGLFVLSAGIVHDELLRDAGFGMAGAGIVSSLSLFFLRSKT